MKVLVTGAGGFIGSHLTEALVREGHEVRALAHYNSSGSAGCLAELGQEVRSCVDIRFGDVTDSHATRALVAGCEVVYHLAALIGIPYSYRAPASYTAVNINGTLNILEACRHEGVKRLMVTSTSEVYGTARYTPMDEDHPLHAQSPYSASKIGAEKLAESYSCSFGLPLTIVRPFNTFGPRQSARAIVPTICSQLAARLDKVHLGALWPKRDLTFVEDTVSGFIALSQCEAASGEIVNLGSGRNISVGDLAQTLIELSGRGVEVVCTEERSRPERSEVGCLLSDAGKARRLSGWHARAPLEEGLRRTLEYVTDNLHRYQPEGYTL